MRSAIYYPEIEITSEATMRAALLMWDELKVIVPWRGFQPDLKPPLMAEAWELIGSTMDPDDEQKKRAHESIADLLQNEVSVQVIYRDAQADKPSEMYPQKLLPETWKLLEEKQLTGAPLANADYPFVERGYLAVMSKLADACAGQTFARWTDRFLAYGLTPDRDTQTAAQTTVVPLTLSLVDYATVPIASLIDFRRRERTERLGHDYTKMRHQYVDSIEKHIEATKDLRSENELAELRRQFEADMRTDLKDLREALGSNLTDTLTSPVVVSTLVAAGSWFATHDQTTVLAAAAAGASAKTVIEKVFELFRLRRGFSTKQREIMTAHPMAYLYQLSRAT